MNKREANFKNQAESDPKETQGEDSRLQEALEILEEIENEEKDERVKELIPTLLDLFHKHFDVDLSPDVSSLYREMSQGKYLLRVDRLSNVVNALFKNKPIEVGGGEDRYANAVVPDAAHIAFAEAEAPGAAVRTAFGISGFNPADAHLRVDPIEPAENDLRDVLLRVSQCRHISGEITSDDLEYIIIRTPTHLFPKELLTEEDSKSGGKFIFRGAKLVESDS